MTSTYPLFQRFPELEAAIPTLGLGTYPSAVRPITEDVRNRLTLFHTTGCELHRSRGMIRGAFKLIRLCRPENIYVAAGSTGTLAGLLYGTYLAGMTERGTRVVGVRVAPRIMVNGWMVRHQMELTYRFLCSRSRQFEQEVPRKVPKVIIDHRWIGKGYGHATESGVEAFWLAAQDDLEGELDYAWSKLLDRPW